MQDSKEKGSVPRLFGGVFNRPGASQPENSQAPAVEPVNSTVVVSFFHFFTLGGGTITQRSGDPCTNKQASRKHGT